MATNKIIAAILLLTSVFACTDLAAQNVGIGSKEPMEKLQVNGNLLIQQPYTSTNTAPTTAQTKTMVNGSTITFPVTDSTGRIYDPGGPAGNYADNLTSTVIINSGGGTDGIEIITEDMDLNAGDSLIIKDNSGITLFKAGNRYYVTGKNIFNVAGLTIIFKSNSDGQTGRGISLLFRRLYNFITPVPYSAFGNVVYFDASNGVFRTGRLSPDSKGRYSTATGYNSIASGDYSTATGYNTEASGSYSTALGFGTTASGDFSTAFGDGTTASGSSSTAFGLGTTASGVHSTAMGANNTASGAFSAAIGFHITASGDFATAIGTSSTASGDYSIAIGNNVSTNGFNGSVVIGDNSSYMMNSFAANTFLARFAGGYRLHTSDGPGVGVSLNSNDNSWNVMSDVRKKENFEPSNGEYFLQKISSFTLSSWNYKGQDAKIHRHYGPMAQDFYAAFGKDKYGTIGNDTTINQADFDGVNFIAIQALTKRTELLNTENSVLKQQVATLQKKIDELNNIVIKRLKQLEAVTVQQKGD